MANNQTNKTTQKREPTPPVLIAYHVTERGEKSFWSRIGAAWDHKDGEGFTVELELLPATGGRIVLRPPLPESENGDEAGA